MRCPCAATRPLQCHQVAASPQTLLSPCLHHRHDIRTAPERWATGMKAWPSYTQHSEQSLRENGRSDGWKQGLTKSNQPVMNIAAKQTQAAQGRRSRGACMLTQLSACGVLEHLSEATVYMINTSGAQESRFLGMAIFAHQCDTGKCAQLQWSSCTSASAQLFSSST